MYTKDLYAIIRQISLSKFNILVLGYLIRIRQISRP